MNGSDTPSLESLIESEAIGLEVLHPGGLEITRELAKMCEIKRGSRVLDVASGSGESACFLVESLDAVITGIDGSSAMIDRARRKAAERGLSISFAQANAHRLPFPDNHFDAAISECTTCILDKPRAIAEMVRVVKPGGFVGIHDLCWQAGTPERLKVQLATLEGEKPETLEGWQQLFKQAGLIDVETVDKSTLIPLWSRSIRRKLGIAGQLRIFFRLFRHRGLHGLLNIWRSERIFSNRHTGYGIIVGRKPA